MNENDCMNFECENLKDDVCRFDDGIVENACILCDLNNQCNRCKNKTKCAKTKSQ